MRFGRLTAGTSLSDLNLLVLTLDTTRADRLGAYGFADILTPTLDRLAHEGVLFRHAYTTAPLTLPAHCSIFTGRNPPRHGVRDNGGFVLDASQATLAEVLKSQGYRTAAFVASDVLSSSLGLDQGFDTYADDFTGTLLQRARSRGRQVSANHVVDRALQWLARNGSSRFFAWLHFYDAHAPYDPPQPYRSTYAGRPYLGEIAFVDAQIGRLFAFLQNRALLERTVIVVVGDHGESLGEHGETTHGLFVYDSVLRVPFVVRAPFRRLKGRTVEAIARTIDVLPTALDLLGVSPPRGIDGVSLIGLMTGERFDLGLEAYAESMYPRYGFGWSDLHALRSGRFKLIGAPRPELFDLEADPSELRNIHGDRPSLERAMTTRLHAVQRLTDKEVARPTSVDPATLERLRGLGYVGPLATVGPDDHGLTDPKDTLNLYRRITQAHRRAGGYQ